jgi:8-oxo-dGTP pyrophosphatase MutT (NUDIX family)
MLLYDLPETKIRDRLAIASQPPLENPYPAGILKGKPQKAAVLIPFLIDDDQWHILFIRRTANANDRHGGQVAFPGGRADPLDGDPIVTAYREAQEEIGLQPQDVRVLGKLNDILTITNYHVTPVVGVIPYPYNFQLAPLEVDRVFTIPLGWLADSANRTLDKRILPAPFEQEVDVIYFRSYAGELLWGASARITVNLLTALFP